MSDMPLLHRPIGVYRCPSCNGTGKVGFSEADLNSMSDVLIRQVSEQMLNASVLLSLRRYRICKQAPSCPKCQTQQIQIIDCKPLATWKCRHCKHTWRYEPLVVQAKNIPPTY